MLQVGELAELPREHQTAGAGGAVVRDVVDWDACEAEGIEAALAGGGRREDRTGYRGCDGGVGDRGVEEGVRGCVEGEVGVGDYPGGEGVSWGGCWGGVEVGWWRDGRGGRGKRKRWVSIHTLTSWFEEGGEAHAEDVGAWGVGGGSRHCGTNKLMGVGMKLEEAWELSRAAMASWRRGFTCCGSL